MITKLRELLLSTPKRQTITLFSAVTLAYALISLFYVGNIVFAGGDRILSGGPGDGTAGLTWLTWIDGGGPVPAAFTHLVNAPFGESLRDPFQITSMFGITGMWLLSELTSPATAWNLMVFVGYMSSALVMFAFIRWLIGNPWIAFFAGFAVTFTPFHQMNALGHLSYMFSALFILVVWAFLAFWRNPTFKRALLLALATAACVYLDGYFILLAGTLLVGIILAALAIDTLFLKRKATYQLARIKGLFTYIGLTLLLLLPVALVQLKYASHISTTLSSQRGDIGSEAQVYSARPYEYLLPADNHPLLPDSYSVFRQDILHGSNFTESTLYIGISIVGLATFAWVWWWRNRDKKLTLQGIPLVFILGTLTFAAFVAFAISLQPKLTLFGQPLPLPSWFVIQITSVWRVFARLYLIVDLGMVIVASIGLYLLVRKWAFRRQLIAIGIALLIVFIELLTQSRAVSWNYNNSPYVYQWLKTQSNVQIIAEYPLGTPPSQSMSDYLTYHQIHGKALFNSARADSPQRPLHLSMAGLADAQTISVLRRLDVDLVLAHRDTTDTIPGLTKLRYDQSKYNDDHVWTYRIEPGQKADYALTLIKGFHLPIIDEQTLRSKTAMGSHGIMKLENLTKKKQTEVPTSFVADAIGEKERFITVAQQGRVLWQGTVTQATLIEFIADPSIPIDVIPYQPTGNQIIDVYDMKAQTSEE